jgi:hypothetical protein
VADILAHYPDVAESSIRTYLSTLAFIVEKGMARRRTGDDEWPQVAPLRTVRGCYRNGPNEIRLVLPVDHDMLRGSGRPIPQPVVDAAGVSPGQRRTFTGPAGQLTLAWRLTSTTGGSVGSLRTHAAAAGAVQGDDLVLILRPDIASFDVATIAGDESAQTRCPNCWDERLATTCPVRWRQVWIALPNRSTTFCAAGAISSCSPCSKTMFWRGANQPSAALP